KVSGWYDLVNRGDKPLREIPLTRGLHWRDVRWTLDGKPATPNDRSGLSGFSPPEPLAKGQKLRVGVAFHGRFPDGVSKKGGGAGQFILPSGVVLTSFGPAFAPVVGYSEQVGIDDENKYESKEYPDDFYLGQTESALGSRMPFTTKVTITGPADFTL